MTPTERYADRVARRLCVQCAAGLQDTDGVRCVECSAYQRRYRAKHAADVAAQYATAKAAKVCADCGAPSPRFVRCMGCRRRRSAYNAAYRGRRAA